MTDIMTEEQVRDTNEDAAFAGALARDGWDVIPTCKDGNCLFRAIAHQVYGSDPGGGGNGSSNAIADATVGGAPSGADVGGADFSIGDCGGGASGGHNRRMSSGTAHAVVRTEIVSYMEANPSLFEPIAEAFGTSLDEYCARMYRDGEWGGYPELIAAEEVYDRPLVIFHSEDFLLKGSIQPRGVHFSGELPEQALETDIVTPMRLSYHGGSHYASVVPDANRRQRAEQHRLRYASRHPSALSMMTATAAAEGGPAGRERQPSNGRSIGRALLRGLGLGTTAAASTQPQLSVPSASQPLVLDPVAPPLGRRGTTMIRDSRVARLRYEDAIGLEDEESRLRLEADNAAREVVDEAIRRHIRHSTTATHVAALSCVSAHAGELAGSDKLAPSRSAADATCAGHVGFLQQQAQLPATASGTVPGAPAHPPLARAQSYTQGVRTRSDKDLARWRAHTHHHSAFAHGLLPHTSQQQPRMHELQLTPTSPGTNQLQGSGPQQAHVPRPSADGDVAAWAQDGGGGLARAKPVDVAHQPHAPAPLL